MSVRGRGLSPLQNIFRHPQRNKEPLFLRYTSCGNATHVVTSSVLVSGFITSPVGPRSSVNVSDYVKDFRFQRHVSSSSQLDSSTAEQLSADWLSQCSVLSSPSAPLFFLLRHFALNSTFFILRDLLRAVRIARHNESMMKFVANYFNNRFLSIRCCSPTVERAPTADS